jgi:hypothetical protein
MILRFAVHALNTSWTTTSIKHAIILLRVRRAELRKPSPEACGSIAHLA